MSMYESNQADRFFFFFFIIFLVIEINSGDKYFVCKFVIFSCKESFIEEYYKLMCLKYIFYILMRKVSSRECPLKTFRREYL